MRESIEYTDTEINIFTKLVNKVLSKKFEWFDKIIFTKLEYNKSPHRYLGFVGEIWVDEKWAQRQLKELYPSSHGLNYEIHLDELVDINLGKEIRKEIFTVFTAITGEKPNKISFSWVQVHFIDNEDTSLQENIQRIKEVMNINEDHHNEYAVIEITKPLSFMSLDYYYQAVPLWKTKEDTIYIKKGPSGRKTISTDNIKVLKTFTSDQEDEMNEYIKSLRNKNNK